MHHYNDKLRLLLVQVIYICELQVLEVWVTLTMGPSLYWLVG
jgi:hypothetical protein